MARTIVDMQFDAAVSARLRGHNADGQPPEAMRVLERSIAGPHVMVYRVGRNIGQRTLDPEGSGEINVQAAIQYARYVSVRSPFPSVFMLDLERPPYSDDGLPQLHDVIADALAAVRSEYGIGISWAKYMPGGYSSYEVVGVNVARHLTTGARMVGAAGDYIAPTAYLPAGDRAASDYEFARSIVEAGRALRNWCAVRKPVWPVVSPRIQAETDLVSPMRWLAFLRALLAAGADGVIWWGQKDDLDPELENYAILARQAMDEQWA